MGYRTLVLQSGEDDYYNTDKIVEIIREIKKYDVALTLSIGEKTYDEYKAFREAGADRYLMRIETTDKDLYHKLDPDMSWQHRHECLMMIKELGYEPGVQKEANYYAIKMPVFSFEKIRGADINLGPEMKSTGECLGISQDFNEALYKAFLGSGVRLPKYKNMIITVCDEDKPEILPIAKRFEALGYIIYSTSKTYKYLTENGVHAQYINKIAEGGRTVIDLILEHHIDLVIDTPSKGQIHSKDGFLIRRNAIETGVTVLTAVDTAQALVSSLENREDEKKIKLIDIARL
jgi:hypothetical protein